MYHYHTKLMMKTEFTYAGQGWLVASVADGRANCSWVHAAAGAVALLIIRITVRIVLVTPGSTLGPDRLRRPTAGYWYKNAVPFPHMLTAFIAIDKCTVENGCMQVRLGGPSPPGRPGPHEQRRMQCTVQVLRGSHHCGRIEHVMIGEQTGADPERVAMLSKVRLLSCVKRAAPGKSLLLPTWHVPVAAPGGGPGGAKRRRLPLLPLQPTAQEQCQPKVRVTVREAAWCAVLRPIFFGCGTAARTDAGLSSAPTTAPATTPKRSTTTLATPPWSWCRTRPFLRARI